VLERLSIRWRLALISAGLTLVILCAFAIAVGEATTSRIRSDFRNQLAAASDDLKGRLRVEVNVERGRVTRISPNLDAYAGAEHAVIRILNDNNGSILGATKGAPNLGRTISFVDRTEFIQGYRVETRHTLLHSADPQVAVPVVIQYARKVSDLESTVNRVRFFLVFGVLGGTLLALVGGLWLAGRAMRPIAALTQTARRIAETRDPDIRVPKPRSDDEVAELARTLDEMLHALAGAREETEAALVRQRQFVADASHELRTPLTSILANLELLAEVLDGEQGETARSALRSSHRMRRLVADLLLLARADTRRQVPHEPTDLGKGRDRGRGRAGPGGGRPRAGRRRRARCRDRLARRAAPAGAEPDGERDQAHAARDARPRRGAARQRPRRAHRGRRRAGDPARAARQGLRALRPRRRRPRRLLRAGPEHRAGRRRVPQGHGRARTGRRRGRWGSFRGDASFTKSLGPRNPIFMWEVHHWCCGPPHGHRPGAPPASPVPGPGAWTRPGAGRQLPRPALRAPRPRRRPAAPSAGA
jgi:two-component system, OmpR family, sensor kinase